jgi:hypothetical protein
MNLNEKEFKPKLSKHELILERYKTLLNSSSSDTSVINNKSTDNQTNMFNKSYIRVTADLNMNENNKIESKLNNIFDSSNIRNFLNNNTKNNFDLNNINSLDKIEMIKAKYSNFNNNQNNNTLYSKNRSTNMFSTINPSLTGNNFNFNTQINDLLNQNVNYEIEMIKSKYANKQPLDLKNPMQNLLEEKLSKYKSQTVASDNKLQHIKAFEENGGLSNDISINHYELQPEDNFKIINKINTLEDKLNSCLSIINKNLNFEKKEIMNKIKDIVNNAESPPIQEPGDLDNVVPIEKNIEKLIKLKKENNLQLIELGEDSEKNKISKESNHSGVKRHTNTNTNEIMNQLIENITGKLFNDINKTHKNTLQNSKIDENEDEIKLMPSSKLKIYKSRASSTPKKKIQTFEEFIQNENKS